jgi:small subunit ribosomal protein S1
MQVEIADHAGFCWGVKRALKIAEKTAAESEGPVTSLGPIIHNPTIVDNLHKQGVATEKDVDAIESGTIVIRAHGIPPETFKKIEEKGLKVADATCPIVKKSQRFARRLTEQGYQVVIVGDKHHPEIIGILGHTDGTAVVIDNPEELEHVQLRDRVGLIAQTTHSVAEYKTAQEAVTARVQEARACDTLCFETVRQQANTVELAKKTDVMIVVGGRNSANTVRLSNMCKSTGVETYHVECAEELQKDWFEGKTYAGVTGGASTPDFLIHEVADWIQKL